VANAVKLLARVTTAQIGENCLRLAAKMAGNSSLETTCRLIEEL
jgi:hypothetical protein